MAFASRASNFVAGDGNGTWDVFVRDRTTGTTEIVSVDSKGDEGNGPSGDPAISGDGRFVVFRSRASDLVGKDTNGKWDIFMHDRKRGNTYRLSEKTNGRQANGHSDDPDISSDGKWVVFESKATNLVKGDTNGKKDIFIHDRVNGVTKLVSQKSNGGRANGGSSNPTVSGNGRFVAFESRARNLAGKDTNRAADIYVHDRKKKKTTRVSMRNGGGLLNGGSWDPTISDNGRWVAFASASSQLVKGDTNG